MNTDIIDLLHRLDVCDRATSQASKTDVASDDESNGNSYVVYEYPGLASVLFFFSP